MTYEIKEIDGEFAIYLGKTLVSTVKTRERAEHDIRSIERDEAELLALRG